MRMLRSTLLVLLLATSQSPLADSLQQIYELALNNDATLKAAEAQFRADIETEKQARGGLLPSVTASLSYADSDTDGDSSFSAGALSGSAPTDMESEAETLTLSLQQKLFDMNAWFNFKSGKELTRRAEAQLAASQQDLIVRVADAYFNVLRAQDNLASAVAEEKAIQRQLEQTQQRFDVGLIAITDVHEAKARYDLALVNRLNEQGQLGIALEALTVITGRVHSKLGRLAENFPVANPEPADRKAWEDFALQNNLDLKAAYAAADAELLNAKATKANHYPTVTAAFEYQDMDSDSEQWIGNFNSSRTYGDIDSDSETKTLSINLTVPLYSGGFTSASRRQAYERYNAARETQILTMRNTIQQTRSLHLQVTTDVARVKARKQSITSSQSALDATQAGYEVGTRNVVDVLDAQRTLFAARRDYANARYDYVTNMLKLKKQAGILSPEDIAGLDKWLQETAAQ